MNIDRKYRIQAVNPCKPDEVLTESDGMFFKAADAAVPAMLDAYMQKCRELGCNPEHVDSIGLLQQRVIQYQKEHSSKVPDTETDCEIDRCIGGIGVES